MFKDNYENLEEYLRGFAYICRVMQTPVREGEPWWWWEWWIEGKGQLTHLAFRELLASDRVGRGGGSWGGEE